MNSYQRLVIFGRWSKHPPAHARSYQQSKTQMTLVSESESHLARADRGCGTVEGDCVAARRGETATLRDRPTPSPVIARGRSRRSLRGGGNEPSKAWHCEGGWPTAVIQFGVRRGLPQSLRFLRNDKQGVFISRLFRSAAPAADEKEIAPDSSEECSDEAIHLAGSPRPRSTGSR